MFLADVKNGSPVVVGVKQSQKAIARDQAAGVMIARDADEHVTGPVKDLCEAKSVPVEPWRPWLSWESPAASMWVHPSPLCSKPGRICRKRQVFILIKSYSRERRCRNAYNQPIGS